MSLNTIINRQALENINTSFGRFVKDASVKDGTVVKADSWTLAGVKSIKVASGDYKGNIFRSAEQVTANNTIRAAFLKSVADIYGGEDHIPESVKTAMKSADFDGKGRPLTARRIRATMDAIQKDLDFKKVADTIETQEWCGEKFIEKQRSKNPALVDALHQYTDKLADDMLDAMKTTILPEVEKGKVPSVDTILNFIDLLAQEDKPETVGVFLSAKLPPPEIEGMRNICRTGAFAKALVRSEAMVKFLFTDDKKASALVRNFALAQEEFERMDNKRRLETAVSSGCNVTATKQVSCCGDLPSVRSYMVSGMSPDAIFSLLVKMADEQANASSEEKKGNVTLARVLDVINYLPDAEQREVSHRFMRHLGQSVLDGTLRPRKPGCDDALYLTGLVCLSNDISKCAANRDKNAKAGNHDLQPETIMGSAEVDAELKTLLNEMRRESNRIRLAARA